MKVSVGHRNGRDMKGIRTLGCLTLNAPPAATIDAAADAGFTSVGLRITGRRKGDPDPGVLRNAAELASLRRRAAERGVRISSVTGYHLYPDVEDDDVRALVDAAVALGAPVLVGICHEPEPASTVRLRRCAAIAVPAGVRIALEFMRFSAIKSLGQALQVVEAIDSPALGVLIDAVHFARSGGTPEELRGIDPARIVLAQLCDGKAHSHPPTDDDLRAEARSGRLFPGDGVLPLREMMAALPPDLEWEFEVPRQDLRALTWPEQARVAHSVFRSFMGELPAA